MFFQASGKAKRRNDVTTSDGKKKSRYVSWTAEIDNNFGLDTLHYGDWNISDLFIWWGEI